MTLSRHMISLKNKKACSAACRMALVLAGCLLGLFIYSPQSQAQSACDPEFMDALESRAWLEAQREITQTKNIISKPDSVLEYTCFHRFVSNLAGAADNPMFSDEHDGVWHVPQMLNSLQVLVGNSLASYLAANFSHDYLDGRGGGLDSGTPNLNLSTGYACLEMQLVWTASQCLDFQNENRDGYFTLDWYQSNDPRTAADGCLPAGGTGAYLSAAYNGNSAPYNVNNGNPADATPYAKDTVQSFLDLILPVGTAPATGCADPIPTGVIVDRTNFTPKRYCDHVCPNPGCYFVPSGSLPGAAGCHTGAPGTTGTCQK